MRATLIQSCHSNGPISMREPQLRTIGAKAMSGTVWLSTIQGSRPHSASRQRCMMSAKPMPDDDADEPADRGDAEGDERGERDLEPQRVRGRRAGHRLHEPGAHVPHVRHREVGGARQHAHVADQHALRRPEQPCTAPRSRPRARGPRCPRASATAPPAPRGRRSEGGGAASSSRVDVVMPWP